MPSWWCHGSLATLGRIIRHVATLRTRDEQLSRSGPGELRLGHEARPKLLPLRRSTSRRSANPVPTRRQPRSSISCWAYAAAHSPSRSSCVGCCGRSHCRNRSWPEAARLSSLDGHLLPPPPLLPQRRRPGRRPGRCPGLLPPPPLLFHRRQRRRLGLLLPRPLPLCGRCSRTHSTRRMRRQRSTHGS